MVLAHLVKSEAACFTLAIQKRSSEVWEILGAVKTEFGKFGDIMDQLKGHLERASKTIDDVGSENELWIVDYAELRNSHKK